MAAPPASPSISTASVPAQTQSGSASSSSSSSSGISSVSSQSRSISSVSSVSSRPVSSSSSSSTSASSSSSPALSTVVLAPGPNAQPDGPPQNNNIAVIVPIVAVACGVVIIYFAYRLYLLHKRRNDGPTPLPPPRTPAILESGRQSVMYTNPQAAPASLSYRNSMRPTSFIYAPSQSNSSLASKGPYTSASGHSTPTRPPMYTPDEAGRFSPLPPPSIRGHSRPHSVASFTSARQSMYGAPTLRGPSYLNRVDIVLPQPLAAQPFTPTLPAPRQRHSIHGLILNPELQHSVMLPPSAATLSPPASSNEVSREEDWTERMVVTEDAESTSTCTAHQRSPSPLPHPPNTTIRSSYTPHLRGFTPSPSLDLHVPGAFPPSIRGRSMSPPEPLLSSNVFVGSLSGSGSGQSDEDRTPRK